MKALFWNTYKNLEDDFLDIAKYIHIDDNQLSTYSMKIADQLTIVSMQIEAISKDIYLCNGGEKKDTSKIYFDTDAIGLMVKLWNIDKKEVLVTCPTLYIQTEKYLKLMPLKEAHLTHKNEWKCAYMDLKHDRVNCLRQGSLWNLMQALAALYLLNQYYSNLQYVTTDYAAFDIGHRFGSQIFSLLVHPCHGLPEYLKYTKEPDFDKYTYLVKLTDSTWEEGWKALREYNKEIHKVLIEKFENYCKTIKNYDNLQEHFKEFETKNFGDSAKEALRREGGAKLRQAYNNLKYEVTLNKNQF